MPKCLLVHHQGEWEVVQWDHVEVSSKMGGQVTFIGCILDLNVYALGMESPPQFENEVCKGRVDIFDYANVKGDVLFVSTDTNGEPADCDVEKVAESLRLKIPASNSV